ncbi:Gfo/Idh/MocA family oxidoreductase [Phanerochaete sordida]|uniref:Gfo/Idh/MocA family oxidoreductase n=1 Tax=Phanerochaete sordida TaxID=48140 RepID=A0A9P3GES1_9APHY|nr:Gfo/Idh/MocA family oxidoreductase [Phanerochaete sordida]
MAFTHPIRIGVIGLSVSGGWASVLLAPILPPAPLAAKYKLTALCTRSPASAQATAEKYSAELGHAVRGYHGADGAAQLANDPDVDLVVVAVKVGEHRAAALPALAAGKPVFVEWPLGNGLQETQELAALARAKGVKNIVGNQVRFSPALLKITEVVKSGQLGKIVGSSVVGCCPTELGYWGPLLGERSSYLADADCGASFLDIALGHFLAGFIPLLGDFTSVSATLATLYPEAALVDGAGKPTGATVARTAEDQIAFTGTLASGAVVSFHFRGGLAAAKPGRVPFEWLIDGEDGTVRVEGPSSFYHIQHPTSVTVCGEPWAPPVKPVDFTGNLAAAWAAIADGEEGAYATFDDAVRVHRVIDAVRRSAREGRRVVIE